MPPFGEADRRREPPCPPLKSVTARGLQRPRGEGGKRAVRAAGGRGASARKRNMRRVGLTACRGRTHIASDRRCVDPPHHLRAMPFFSFSRLLKCNYTRVHTVKRLSKIRKRIFSLDRDVIQLL